MSSDPEYLEVRALQPFTDMDRKAISQGACLVVPTEVALRWKAAGVVEVIGPAEPQETVPEKGQEEPEPEAEPGISLDSIQTPTVRVRCLEGFTNREDRGNYIRGQVYEVPKENVRAAVRAGYLQVLGPGTPPEPTLEERVQALEAAVSELREHQSRLQNSLKNIELLIHPTRSKRNRR